MITTIEEKQDFEEDLRREFLNEKAEESLMNYIEDNPDLYEEFVKDNYYDEFKKYAAQAYEDSR